MRLDGRLTKVKRAGGRDKFRIQTCVKLAKSK
jgi:hypothetical protein